MTDSSDRSGRSVPRTSTRLEGVRVPDDLVPLFERAETYVRAYFSDQHSNPSEGTLSFHGERYIRVRAASISIEFFDLVRKVWRGDRDADQVARSLLFDVAHAIGHADAADFRDQMEVEEPLEALSAGPVHFAWAGWALVDLSAESVPTPDENYLLIYDHPHSFEADAWLKQGRTSTHPVCVMNAGYSSGWSESAFGIPLVAREIRCRAQGHDACRFIMAPPERMDEQIAAYRRAHPDVQFDMGPPVPRFFEQLQRREAELLQAQRREAVGQVAGGIAHDFNNLLTVILACAEQIELGADEGSVTRRNAEAIVGAAERAGRLTRQLLALAHQPGLDMTVVDLGHLLADLRPLLSGLLGERVRLEMPPAAALPYAPVEVEPSGVEQIIVNLAVNALEAMPDGGTLSIALGVLDTGFRLTVRDDGVGIPPDILARVKEPFFSTKTGNSGLGLATAYGLALQFGGSLEIESVVGEGTAVHFDLPRSTRAPEPKSDPIAIDRREAVLLIVEDDSLIRSMLSRFLPRQGYEVHSAASGAEAVEVARGLPRLDVVLSDVVMPDLSGPETVEQLRAVHPGVPALFMTGYAEHHLDTLPSGSEVLCKPFGLDAVHARLSALLDRSGASETA
jgi:signal transduction histidine kinase/CheY-like chemotaxis protein